LFKTPSPETSEKKQKYNLSELDQKQKAIIPEALPKPAEAPPSTEKVRKPEKKSRKKRRFEQMLAGFDANLAKDEKAGAFQAPFGTLEDQNIQQEEEAEAA